MTGKKDDNNKLRLDLIPPEFDESLAEIFAFGAQKYGERNCEKGIASMRLYAAARRHMLAWVKGKDINAEDGGLSHAAQAAWNMLLIEMQRRRGTGTDDRPTSPVGRDTHETHDI